MKLCKAVNHILTRCTGDTSILVMATVVNAPALELTLIEAGLIPSTLNVVHPYLSGSSSKVSVPPSGCGSACVAKLTTDDISIILVPVVITDCPPLVAVVDLDTPLVVVAAMETVD